jgi:flagellum-specific peptidoglycan hydrolase FlgJ
MTQQEFIKKFSKEIIISTIGTSLFPSVKMAQAALETGYGKSIQKAGNNMFGIKAYGDKTPYWKGDYINLNTHEYYAGTPDNVNDKFRSYKTITDSIRDHSYFLKNLEHYKPVFLAKNPQEQAKALQNAGYATDPNYANKLIAIMDKHNLYKLDKKKTIMKNTKIALATLTIIFCVMIIIENFNY